MRNFLKYAAIMASALGGVALWYVLYDPIGMFADFPYWITDIIPGLDDDYEDAVWLVIALLVAGLFGMMVNAARSEFEDGVLYPLLAFGITAIPVGLLCGVIMAGTMYGDHAGFALLVMLLGFISILVSGILRTRNSDRRWRTAGTTLGVPLVLFLACIAGLSTLASGSGSGLSSIDEPLNDIGAALPPSPEPEPVIEPDCADPYYAGSDWCAGAVDVTVTTPPYPSWPPEEPSSRMRLSPLLQFQEGQSLADVSERIESALIRSGYEDYSFYSAPGGFVVVTRIEAMNEDGTAKTDGARFQLPRDMTDRDLSLYQRLRKLFLEAPPGHYRFILFVVTTETYVTSDEQLAEADAIQRLQDGAQRLGKEFDALPFTREHSLEALIYEFELKDMSADDRTIAPLLPGTIEARQHLAKTRIGGALGQALDSPPLRDLFGENP